MTESTSHAALDCTGAGEPGALVATPTRPESVHWIETLRDGTAVLIRPIGRHDRALERALIERLSPETRRFRFLGQVQGLSEAQLDRFCAVDYDRDMAFIALVQQDGGKREVGVSRYCATRRSGECECAIVIADEWQHRGLGAALMRHLMAHAREHGFTRMISIDRADNAAMRDLARYLGFAREVDPDDFRQVVHSIAL